MLITKSVILLGFLAVAVFSCLACQPVPEARLFDRETNESA